jgi:heavy-metal exporter, HME family
MLKSLPAGVLAPRVTFRQADFIEASIDNLQAKLLRPPVWSPWCCSSSSATCARC